MSVAYLGERDLFIEIAKEALDFMAYAEVCQAADVEHGGNSVPAMLARGKLFKAVHAMHKSGLRKRILAVFEQLAESTRKYEKEFRGRK